MREVGLNAHKFLEREWRLLVETSSAVAEFTVPKPTFDDYFWKSRTTHALAKVVSQESSFIKLLGNVTSATVLPTLLTAPPPTNNLASTLSMTAKSGASRLAGVFGCDGN